VALNITVVGTRDRQLSEFLRIAGMNVSSIPMRELDSLALSSAGAPNALVIDLRDEESLPSTLGPLKRQHPEMGIVIVASRLDPSLMLDAMRAGVTEWVSEPLSQVDLKAAIDRVSVQQPQSRVRAQIFGFVGAKGGVGTTTIAVNVATALKKLSSQPTLLIDLNFACGDAALFMSVEPRFSVVDAIENRHRLDSAFFHGLAVPTKAGPDLLASSDRTMLAPVDVRAIPAVIDFAAREYAFIVLDLPRSDSALLDQLEQVSHVTIVANQELATVRAAARLASALRHRYGSPRINVVVSRYDKDSDIGKDDIARTVGSPIKYVFPSDYRTAVEALNVGRPVVVESNSRLAGSFVEFSRSIAGLTRTVSETEKPAGLFSRFGARR
jgi:pilus assembly protein CpaE